MAYYNTLNEALAAENETLVELFPLGLNLNYGQTVRFVKDGVFCAVYRNEQGMYEKAISYASKCKDFLAVA